MLKNVLCSLCLLGMPAALTACESGAPETEARAGLADDAIVSPSARPYLTLHLANLSSEEAEQDMLAILDTFNQAIAEVGYPDVRYTLWEVDGQHEDFYAYIYYALWPDYATYREVQRQPAYVQLNRLGPLFRQTVAAERFQPFELNDATRPVDSLQRTPPSDEPRALYLYQLYSGEDDVHDEAHEAALQEMLADLDRAAAEAGHPETHYALWNSLSDRTELPRHLVVGFWPSPRAYTSVQDDDGFADALGTYRLGFEEMFPQILSNLYIEVLPE